MQTSSAVSHQPRALEMRPSPRLESAGERARELRLAQFAARAGDMLSHEDERRLARAARAGDQHAFDRLIRAHMPLAHAIAWQFRSFGLPLEELTSEAMIGLVKGARDFDPERGVRLAAYAALWIRAYLRRYTLDYRRIVRSPSTRNTRKVIARLRQTEHALERERGEKPDAEAVALALGVAARDVEDVRALWGGRDMPCDNAAQGAWSALASGCPSPELLVAEAEERDHVHALVHGALSHLDRTLREVVEQRHLAEKPRTLAELGKEMGVSHESVRQMEIRAKKLLRATIDEAMAGSPQLA